MCKKSTSVDASPCRREYLHRAMFALFYQLATVTLFSLCGQIPVSFAEEGDDVEYTFGRPVNDDEHTYEWYRKTHADWAAKRYGVDPKKVGDGMDTWHW